MKLEICLSPYLLPLYTHKDKTVVVVDIFRASSAIVTAMAEGVQEIIPVNSLEIAHDYHQKGFIVAAERNGEIVNGFKYGNSPFHFQTKELKGKQIVFTTTNFTNVVGLFQEANKVLIGSFLNISQLVNKIALNHKDVLIVCAGYKNKINLEDSLFAGFLANALSGHISTKCDSTTLMMESASNCPSDKWEFLKHSSHRARLEHLNILDDILFCLKEDVYQVVPEYDKGKIINSESTVTI